MRLHASVATDRVVLQCSSCCTNANTLTHCHAKQNCTQPTTKQQVQQMGLYFGIKADEDKYIWEVAEMGLCAPLPPGWKEEVVQQPGEATPSIAFRQVARPLRAVARDSNVCCIHMVWSIAVHSLPLPPPRPCVFVHTSACTHILPHAHAGSRSPAASNRSTHSTTTSES